jgi:hypothetical protein
VLVLARLYPQDKTQNASGLRRSLDPIANESAPPSAVEPALVAANHVKAKLLLALVIALRAVGAACAADDRSILTREIIC